MSALPVGIKNGLLSPPTTMKPIEYWERKRAETQTLLEHILLVMKPNTSFDVPDAPRKQKNRERWETRCRCWKRERRWILRHKRCYENGLARLEYIEDRIKTLTPTFWAFLNRA